MTHSLLFRTFPAALLLAVAPVVALAQAAATAQAPAAAQGIANGVVDTFKGAVMVLKDKTYLNVTKNMPLAEGDRVLALDRAAATIVVTTHGHPCQVTLSENQAFTVRDLECRALLDSVQPIAAGTVPPVAVSAAAGAGVELAPLLGAGVLVGGAAIYSWDHPKASGD